MAASSVGLNLDGLSSAGLDPELSVLELDTFVLNFVEFFREAAFAIGVVLIINKFG
jgi:hypothetical protein